MTDRELLEAAAKAAGIGRNVWDYEWVRSLGHMVTPSMMWNPLTSNSEALQLAVTLRINIYNPPGENASASRMVADSVCSYFDEQSADAAAVRRAIVRCAADAPKKESEPA
jgi:hypothetical protein